MHIFTSSKDIKSLKSKQITRSKDQNMKYTQTHYQRPHFQIDTVGLIDNVKL